MADPPPASTIYLTPDDALRVWQQRGTLRPTVNWREMIQGEHAAAFTVAKVAKLELLATIRTSLDDVIRNGGTFAEWKRDLLPQLQRHGWWGVVNDPELTGTTDTIVVNDRRLRTIYRTNIRMSIAGGRWRKFQREKHIFPYLRYLSDHYRKHPRLNHKSWHGIILPIDDPTWEWMFPPNGWGCNCRVEQVSDARMRRNGWSLSEPPDPGFAPFETPSGIINVPNGVAPGFGYNPGIAHLRVLSDKLAATLDAAEQAGFATAAAQVRQQVSHEMRDALLTGSAAEQRILQGVSEAVTATTQTEIELARPVINLLGAQRQFTSTLPHETIRKVQNKHGVNGFARDTYPIISSDWSFIPHIIKAGRRYLDARANNTRSLIYVLRVGDLDYVYIERIGLKRGEWLRGKTFFKEQSYQPPRGAAEIL